MDLASKLGRGQAGRTEELKSAVCSCEASFGSDWCKRAGSRTPLHGASGHLPAYQEVRHHTECFGSHCGRRHYSGCDFLTPNLRFSLAFPWRGLYLPRLIGWICPGWSRAMGWLDGQHVSGSGRSCADALPLFAAFLVCGKGGGSDGLRNCEAGRRVSVHDQERVLFQRRALQPDRGAVRRMCSHYPLQWCQLLFKLR